MPISEVLWPEDRMDHITRHGVTPEEFEQEGKLADLALLSRDILTVPSDEIRQLTVDMTVADGTVVHERAERT